MSSIPGIGIGTSRDKKRDGLPPQLLSSSGIKCINEECDGTMIPFYILDLYGKTHWVCPKCGTKMVLSYRAPDGTTYDKGYFLYISKATIVDNREAKE